MLLCCPRGYLKPFHPQGMMKFRVADDEVAKHNIFCASWSNPEVLFKALTLLVNLLYIFIYAYTPLP